jgi:hypothetical protein
LTVIDSKRKREHHTGKAVGFLSSHSNQQDNIKDDEELTVFCKRVFKNNQRRVGGRDGAGIQGRGVRTTPIKMIFSNNPRFLKRIIFLFFFKTRMKQLL